MRKRDWADEKAYELFESVMNQEDDGTVIDKIASALRSAATGAPKITHEELRDVDVFLERLHQAGLKKSMSSIFGGLNGEDPRTLMLARDELIRKRVREESVS